MISNKSKDDKFKKDLKKRGASENKEPFIALGDPARLHNHKVSQERIDRNSHDKLLKKEKKKKATTVANEKLKTARKIMNTKN